MGAATEIDGLSQNIYIVLQFSEVSAVGLLLAAVFRWSAWKDQWSAFMDPRRLAERQAGEANIAALDGWWAVKRSRVNF
jgi:hypothetical protein